MSQSERRNKFDDKLHALLNPDELKTSLLIMAVFIAAFELLRERLQANLKSFFSEGYDKNGPIVGHEYRKNVLDLHKNPTRAALIWFSNAGALTPDDLKTFDEVRRLRNEIAHEMFDRFGAPDTLRYAEAFGKLVALLRKVEVWWIMNVELPTNPDFDGEDLAEVDEEDVIPGPIIGIQMVVQALFDEEGSAQFREAFERTAAGQQGRAK